MNREQRDDEKCFERWCHNPVTHWFEIKTKFHPIQVQACGKHFRYATMTSRQISNFRVSPEDDGS